MKLTSVATLFLLFFALGNTAGAQQAGGNFVAPRCLTGSDMAYPIDTTTSGLVTFAVSLDQAGNVTDVKTVRDVPPLTDAALLALKTWTFAPATLDGQGVASRIMVDILFNPGNAAFGHTPPLSSGAPSDPPAAEDFAPPNVAAAAYAPYPIKAMLSGPIVFDVEVGRSGRVRKATPVYTTPSLVSTATAALKKWHFSPGKYHDAPVVSDTVVAFVFRSPTITTPYGSQQQ